MLELVKRGTKAGLFAGATVALVVLVHDLVQLEPLATPKLLARNLFGWPVSGMPVGAEASSGSGSLVWIADLLAGVRDLALFTAAHFSVFAVVGLAGAWLFRPGLLPANVATGALFGAGVWTAVLYAGMLLLAPEFVSVPPWPFLVLTNALAGVVLVSQLVDVPEPVAG